MRPQTQLSRCFIQPIEDPPENKGGKGGKRRRQTWREAMLREIIETLNPWPHPALVFDVETTTDAHSGQRAKVGFWQDRGLKYADRCNLFAQGKLTQEAMDICWREGVFYNVKTCPPREIETVRAFAAKHDLAIMEMADFIKKVFYRQAKLNTRIAEPKMILGHNPVFDFGAISRHTGKSCDEKLYGAVSLGLCNCREADEVGGKRFMACGYHPNIKIKKLGPGKHIMKCGLKYDGRDRKGKPKYVDMCLEFLDTRQLAGALLGAGCDKSVEALCRMLKTATQKRIAPPHGEEITEEYLDYARDDVQCTWELFVKLRDLYKLHGIKKRITKIYSEASIGKGHYEELGVKSFFGFDQRTKRNTRNLEFDPKVRGIAMEGLFGGRSEARYRHVIMECMLPDFRSQYPSVNALMKLQDLLLCERLDVHRNSNTAKLFLEAVDLTDFQDPATWPKLRGFARVRPSDNDVLPLRCEYETSTGAKQINVGVNFIKSACDGWWSFPDVCSSKVITGKYPEILETIEFIPVGCQTTNIIKLFGNPNYTIDLTKDDLFTKVIELRTTVESG